MCVVGLTDGHPQIFPGFAYEQPSMHAYLIMGVCREFDGQDVKEVCRGREALYYVREQHTVIHSSSAVNQKKTNTVSCSKHVLVVMTAEKHASKCTPKVLI